jgi:hypothetical protein
MMAGAVLGGFLIKPVEAQDVISRHHNHLVQESQTACAPYKGRKLTLVIPVKPGGGFDLMGRALVPFLADHSGMRVSVVNIAGSSGLLAIKSVAESSDKNPAVGLINLGSFATQLATGRSGAAFSDLVGLGVMSTDQAVWVSRNAIDWSNAAGAMMTVASPSSPYVRFGIPAQLLGLNMQPIFGYEGSNQAWMAMLRGEVDVVTMSDQSALRNLATGAQAKVSLTLTDRPLSPFSGVPHLAGPGGLLDAKTKGMNHSERERLMSLGSLVVMLAEQSRTLVTSANLRPAMLTCLQRATEAALFDPSLTEVAHRQKFDLNSQTAVDAQAKIGRVRQALQTHQDYLRGVAAAWKESK